MLKRIEHVKNKFTEQKIDALFITNQSNVTYLTGFTGLAPHERESFLLVTQTSTYLFTFPTYFGMFRHSDPPAGGEESRTVSENSIGILRVAQDDNTLDVRCITQEKRLRDHLNGICQKEGIKTVGFEKENITVAELESLKTHVLAHWKDTLGIVEEFRVIKDQEEMTNIRKAAEVTDEAFSYILGKIKNGVTEKDIALEIEYFIKKHADDVSFSPIVAFNDHAAIPHYIPNHESRIMNQGLVLLDFGAKVNGYCSDMTRVVFLGTPNEEHVKVYNAVLQAQETALKMLEEKMKIDGNVKGAEIDEEARAIITAAGFPEFPHGLGHGVGLAIHEAPRLRKGCTDILKPGMVVTVEPGIYLEGHSGVRIEDLVVLTKAGIEILSKSSKEIITL